MVACVAGTDGEGGGGGRENGKKIERRIKI